MVFSGVHRAGIFQHELSMKHAIAILCLLASVASAQPRLSLEPAFPNLQFSRPVDLQDPGDGSGRLFVVEQEGRIRVFQNDPATESMSLFLDIRDRVNDSGNEEGLLGLAFHPLYGQNGRLFVHYTARGSRCSTGDRCSIVSEFSVSTGSPDRADPGSERVILDVFQPFSNHNGGQISFGPDSLLYVALGDGGSGGDPQGHGQNRRTLLGSIVRIDIDRVESGLQYGIPPDNPFVGTQFSDEIFAYGLRNPWRFSFDTETGDLWTGDVGQGSFEEIDVVEIGGNYGWNTMEGSSCFSPSSGCDRTGLVLPVHVYQHGSSTGRSVTGGFVYRGDRIPELAGTYVYGDFVSGRIWGLSQGPDGLSNTLINSEGRNISSFGTDAEQRLFILSFDGRVYRFEGGMGTGSADELPDSVPQGVTVYPNPTDDFATLRFTLSEPANSTVDLFDVTGRLVTRVLDANLAAGEHRISLAVDQLPSGAYYSTVTTSGGQSSAKIVVL